MISAPGLEYLRHISELAQQGNYREAAALIREAFTKHPDIATKENHERLAHLLVLGADWELIIRFLPPATNSFLTTGWLRSLLETRPLNAEGKPLPWLTYPAIEFLEMKTKPNWRVLEWGSGSSTWWWMSRVQTVVSIEHSESWHDIVKAGVTVPNVQLKLITDPQKYVSLEGVIGDEPFDVFLIDGEQRNQCVRAAAARAKADSIIVLDNSDQAHVREAMMFLGEQGWKRIDFYGLIPTYLYRICTSVFFRDDRLLTGGPFPSDHQSILGPTLDQAMQWGAQKAAANPPRAALTPP